MKILHTIEGFGAKFGGIVTCTFDLLSAMQNGDDVIELLSPSLRDATDRDLGKYCVWAKTYPNDGVGPFNYSRNLNKALAIGDYDIYHANGMWQYIVHKTCRVARQKKRHCVITPHGMLYPEALARSAWKKWPLRKLWFDRDIREADCIHVTCETEMTHIRALGYAGTIALIGNPVAIPSYTSDLFALRLQAAKPFWGVGFLGRLHPRKKVENLLYGVALTAYRDLQVYIVGKGDDAYERFLLSEAQRLGIGDRVHFLGFMNGREKFEQLAKLDALFVPSDMENFGMIVPEALIVGTPVMASLGTPWKVLNTERCGWWRDNSPETIAKVIDELYSTSPSERRTMAARGREYIQRAYASDMIAAKMHRLYRWLLGETTKPDYVYEN